MVNLVKLRKLAEAATEGPWKAFDGHKPPSDASYTRIESDLSVIAFGLCSEDCSGDCDSNYIAELSPDKILWMINRIEELESSKDNVHGSSTTPTELLRSLVNKIEQYAGSGCIDAYLIEEDPDCLSECVDRANEYINEHQHHLHCSGGGE